MKNIKSISQIKKEGLLNFKQALIYCQSKYPEAGSWDYILRRALSRNRIVVFRPGESRTAQTFFSPIELDKWMDNLWKNKKS